MFCILIPTVNRKDLLMEALQYYKNHYPNTDILILDNGQQNIPQISPRIYIWESDINKGVAGSWNFLIQRAIEMGYEYFLVCNDDIIYQEGAGQINALIIKWGEYSLLQPRPYYNWSIFLISKTIFAAVGEFDEAFQRCFFEDNDYQYRVKLAGFNLQYSDELSPKVYRCSQTTQKSPELGGYVENRDYYLTKWGGLPNNEIYKTPFNK